MNDTQISSTVSHDLQWIRTHAILAIVLLIVLSGLTFGAVSLIDGIQARHDAAKDVQTQLILSQMKASTAAAETRAEQDRQVNAARDAQQTQLINGLISEMAKQRAALQQQLEKDKTLSAKEAADRLAQQVQASPGEVTASGDNIVVNLPIGRRLVSNMDSFAQAQRDVTNLGGQLEAQKVLTADAKQNYDNAQKVITADKVELIAQIKADVTACQVRVDAEAGKGRKRTFWASVASLITGIVLRSRF